MRFLQAYLFAAVISDIREKFSRGDEWLGGRLIPGAKLAGFRSQPVTSPASAFRKYP